MSSNGVGGRVSYDYNVLGQRISRKEIIGSDLSADRQANIEYYIHDGVNIVADLDEDKELLRSYIYAPGYDNIISMTTYGYDEDNSDDDSLPTIVARFIAGREARKWK